MGIRSIERVKNVPNTLVLKWIKKFGTIVKDNLIKKANNIELNNNNIKYNIEQKQMKTRTKVGKVGQRCLHLYPTLTTYVCSLPKGNGNICKKKLKNIKTRERNYTWIWIAVDRKTSVSGI